MANSLGIFMDHSSAQIIEFTTDPMESITVDSTFSRQDKVESLGKSENLMHNKEQQQQTAYFKQLADVIKNYDAVVLFGPTDAKAQLYNILKADNRFEKIKIEPQRYCVLPKWQANNKMLLWEIIFQNNKSFYKFPCFTFFKYVNYVINPFYCVTKLDAL